MKGLLIILLRGPYEHTRVMESLEHAKQAAEALIRQITTPPAWGWVPPAFVEAMPGFYVRSHEISAVIVREAP